MLQQREIAKILSQVISESGSLLQTGAYSVSLLSSNGLPLITVTSPDSPAPDYSVSADSLRVYSLLAINSFNQQEKCGDSKLDDWMVLSLDETLRAIVKRFVTVSKGSYRNELYVIIFYGNSYSDDLAKVSVDSLAEIFADGLQGYIPGWSEGTKERVYSGIQQQENKKKLKEPWFYR